MNTLEFRDLYNTNYQSLLTYANRMTHDVNQSKDILQEAMIKAYQSLDSLDDSSKFKGWSFTIIKNIYINQYKKKVRRRNLKSTTKFKINVTDRTSVANEGVHHLQTQFILDRVKSIKSIYSDLIMKHAQGYSYQEISEQFNIPLGTVKSRISTARNLLRKELVPFGYKIAA